MANWYKQLHAYLVKLANEYWITDSGDIAYADGDVGDVNHEGYVISTLLSNHGFETFDGGGGGGYDVSDPQGMETFVFDHWDEIKTVLASQGNWDEQWDVLAQQDQKSAVKQVAYNCSQGDCYLAAGATPEEASIMDGHGDARLFAQKNWGWKAVRGTNVETYTLTQKDLQTIGRGLGEIAEQDGGGYDDGSESDTEYNIYVITGGWYRNIPLSAIESGDLNSIMGGASMMQGKLIEDVPVAPRKVVSPYYAREGD